jgi:hypothetical protein
MQMEKSLPKVRRSFKITPDEVMKEESEDEVLARKKQVSTDLLNFS